jgi:ABC-type phosphate transport system substrate-binding protein
MATMKVFRTALLVLGIATAFNLLQAKELAVVADTANPTSNLTTAELIKIFNQHTRNWPDGKPIVVVLRDPESADMQLVLRKVLNMTPDQAREFIQEHRGAIIIAPTDDAVLRFVSSTRGAIGVIDLYSLTKGVTVLKIDGKLPVQQGYLLRGN